MVAKSNTVYDGSITGAPVHFVRLAGVVARVGVSEITIYRWEQDGVFPRRRKIGRHAVAWVEAEIDDWCAARAAGEPWGGEQ